MNGAVAIAAARRVFNKRICFSSSCSRAYSVACQGWLITDSHDGWTEKKLFIDTHVVFISIPPLTAFVPSSIPSNIPIVFYTLILNSNSSLFSFSNNFMVFEDNDHICFLVIKYVSYFNDFLFFLSITYSRSKVWLHWYFPPLQVANCGIILESVLLLLHSGTFHLFLSVAVIQL